MTWTCPRSAAPFANRDATHSGVTIDQYEWFARAESTVRAAFAALVREAAARVGRRERLAAGARAERR